MRYYCLIALIALVLADGLSPECNEDLLAELQALGGGKIDSILDNALFNTGFGFNDLGKYDGCKYAGKQYLLGKGKFLALPEIGYKLDLYLGICVPVKCKTPENLKYMADTVKNNGFIVFDYFSFRDPDEINDKHKDWNVTRIIVFTFLGLLTLLCIGTHRLFMTKEAASRTVFCLFDPSENFYLIFGEQRGGPGLASVDGVRVLLASLIVAGHINNTILTLPLRNPETMIENIKSFWWQIIYNSFYAVDTFFFISGFFMAFQVIGRVKEITAWKAYDMIKFRFLRLYPIYAIVFLYYWQVMPMFMEGPVAGDNFNENHENCNIEAPWILTMTQIWIYDFKTTEAGCAGWYWYLPNDFFCSFLGIMLLAIYLKNTKHFWIAMTFVMAVFFGLEIFFTYDYDIGVNILEWKDTFRFFDVYYSRFYIRASPYLIGIMLGVFFKNYELDSKEGRNTATRRFFDEIKESDCKAIAQLLVGFAAMAFLVFIIYPSYEDPWSSTVNIIYNVLNKKLFVIAFFFWLVPVVLCKVPLVSDFLGAYFFSPLGRVSYCVYLIHPLVEKIVLFNTRTNITFSLMWYLLYAVSSIILTFLIAIPVSLIYEMPMHSYRIKMAALERMKKEKATAYKTLDSEPLKVNNTSTVTDKNEGNQTKETPI